MQSLGLMMKIVGERPLLTYLDKLDKGKLEKTREYFNSLPTRCVNGTACLGSKLSNESSKKVSFTKLESANW